MNKESLCCALLLGALAWMPFAAQATLMSRLGGQAYYDPVLDITWLADANLAASNTFGVGGINADGSMNWNTANAWIAGMNGASHLGFSDWRLPTLSPVSGGAAFNTDFSNNGTTDRGYGETGIGWDTGAGVIVSEMGWMYYGNLGNLGFCTPNDGAPSLCTVQAGFGLSNTGPFSNLQFSFQWSGVEDASSIGAWIFDFAEGNQVISGKGSTLFAWAVRSGDVAGAAPVPEPGTVLLLGAGLMGMVGARARFQRATARPVPAPRVSDGSSAAESRRLRQLAKPGRRWGGDRPRCMRPGCRSDKPVDIDMRLIGSRSVTSGGHGAAPAAGLVLLTAMVLGAAAPQAGAVAIYEYQGNPFTDIFPASGGLFSTSDSIVGRLTLDAPLAANLSDADLTGASGFALRLARTDLGGIGFGHDSPGTTVSAQVSTDALGDIIGWDIRLRLDLGGSDFLLLRTRNEAAEVRDLGQSQTGAGFSAGAIVDAAGTWRCSGVCDPPVRGVSEPGTVLLLSLGTMALGVRRRRRCA
jgi:hypothetical protein